MPRIAKAVYLIIIVIAWGEILSAAVYRRIRDAVPVFNARRAELHIIPRIGFGDGGMVRGAKSLLMRFIEHRRHQIAVNGEEFNAVQPRRFYLAHPRPRFFHIARCRRIVIDAVDEKARRGDFSLVALLAPEERFFWIAADFSDRRDATRQPQLPAVFDRLRDSAALILN